MTSGAYRYKKFGEYLHSGYSGAEGLPFVS